MFRLFVDRLYCGFALCVLSVALIGCGGGGSEGVVEMKLPESFELDATVQEEIERNISRVRSVLAAEDYVDMSLLPEGGRFAPPEHPGDPVTLKVGLPWIFNDQHAPLYIAKRLGFFAAEGIEVDLREGGPGRNPLALLAGGSVDIAVSSSGNAVIRLVASETGVDVVALGAMNRGSGYSWLHLDGDTPKGDRSQRVLKPGDFDGALIGIQEGAELAQAYFLANFSYLKDRVRFVKAGFTPDALMAGKIDFYAALYENQPRLIEAQGFNNWIAFRFQDYGIVDFANVHVVLREVAEGRKEVLRRYLRAVCRATEFLLSKPEEAAAITQGFSTTSQLSKEQILRRFELQRSFIDADGKYPLMYTPLDTWDVIASQLFTYKQIELKGETYDGGAGD
ncbi:MAG: ABC transporter substrate-binding protein [Verrucomicrobiota bacterium]